MGKLATIQKPRVSYSALEAAMAKRDELIVLYQELPKRIRMAQLEIDRMVSPSNPAAMYLSRRQREVLELLVCELSNKEIAVRLHIEERTVKFHVSNLLHKYGHKTRMGLLR